MGYNKIIIIILMIRWKVGYCNALARRIASLAYPTLMGI